VFRWSEKYNKEGLKQPVEIKEATQQYKLSNDKFTIFLKQELIESDKNVTFADVYKKYCEWCKTQKIIPIGKTKIIQQLKQQNILKSQATVNGKTKSNVIIGYQLQAVVDEK